MNGFAGFTGFTTERRCTDRAVPYRTVLYYRLRLLAHLDCTTFQKQGCLFVRLGLLLAHESENTSVPVQQ
jgi:hypothetical protein